MPDPRPPGTLQDAGDIARELLRAEVTVGIDEHGDRGTAIGYRPSVFYATGLPPWPTPDS
jgi:hypothetical protein